MLVAGTFSTIAYFKIHYSDETTAFRTAVQKVVVRTDDGRVTVRTGAAGAEGAVVTSRGTSSFRTARHTESVTDGVLTVQGHCEGGFFLASSCSMDFELTVAAGTVVDARTSVGEIRVTGTGAAVTAHSSTGDLRVSRVGSPVRLSTDVGDVIADQLPGGDVSGESDTGDIRLDFSSAPDRLSAITEVGDVRVAVPDDGTSYLVSSDLDLGDTQVDVPVDPGSPHTARLRTNTGDIRMGLTR